MQLAVSRCVLRGLCCPALEVAEIGELRHVIDVQQPVQPRRGLCDPLCIVLEVGKHAHDRVLNHVIAFVVIVVVRDGPSVLL